MTELMTNVKLIDMTMYVRYVNITEVIFYCFPQVKKDYNPSRK